MLSGTYLTNFIDSDLIIMQDYLTGSILNSFTVAYDYIGGLYYFLFSGTTLNIYATLGVIIIISMFILMVFFKKR